MIMDINNIKLLSMKKTFKYIGLFVGLFTLLFMNACKEDIDPIVDELTFSRAFSPLKFSASITNQTTVTFTWVTLKDADHYVLEIYEGTDIATGTLLETTEIDGNLTTYSCILTGDTDYFGRLMAVSSLEGVEDSKWSEVGFATAPENLFRNYVTEMTALNACIVRWTPGSTVTALVFDDGTSETTYPITSDELTAGAKDFTAMANDEYEIRLMYNTVVRGTTRLLIQGDILLDAGGDLTAALDAMTAGQVLVLANGTSYGMSEPDTVDVSIKIRGMSETNRPIIFLVTGGGNHMFDIDPSLTLSDSLVFENIDISCSYDDGGVTRHRGVIDQENTALHLGLLKFNNCIIRNSDRSAIRLRGNAGGQEINKLEITNCLIHSFAVGTTQSYSVINPNANTAAIHNITISNTTVYNCKNGLILYGAGIDCRSITVDNCTFDQMSMDAASGRWFIDMGSAAPAPANAGPLTISDCIFGQTSTLANGVRPNGMTLSVIRSYYTSDFYDGTTGPIKGYMTAYTGASTALWKAPFVDLATPVDYSFQDTNFAGIATGAGDPRWLE